MAKTTKRRKGVWLAYDLGVDGDYEALYHWLDSHDAVECGDNAAFVRLEGGDDFVEALREELKRVVRLRPRDRMYAIYPSAEGRYKGKFLIGSRKRAPWEGYAGQQEAGEDEPV